MYIHIYSRFYDDIFIIYVLLYIIFYKEAIMNFPIQMYMYI